MAEVAGDRRLIAAHGAAVKTALAHVERHMAATRIRDGTNVRREQTNNLIIASFQHGTSRAQDPQLHTHNVIMNATQSEDGSWRSLEPRAIYQLQKEIGAIYRQELAHKVRELGYDIETSKGSMFEIKDVSSEVMTAFSTRTGQIEAALAKRGTTMETASAMERQIATLDTREAKIAIDHAELIKNWRETANDIGFGPTTRMGMVRQAEARSVSTAHKSTMAVDAMKADRAVACAAEKLGERQSVFSVTSLIEEAGQFGLGKINHAQVSEAIDHATKQGDIVARTFLDRRGAEFTGFATRENVEIETKILQTEHDGRGIMQPIVSPLAAAKVVARAASKAERAGYAWNAEQRAATEQLLTSRNRVTALQGYAGTAKTTTVLATVAKEAEARGETVTALAPIRDTLAKSGVLTGRGATMQSLVNKGLTRAEARDPLSYDMGDVVRFTRDYADKGVSRGEAYRIESIDPAKSAITLKSEDGRVVDWRLRQWGAGNSQTFTPQSLELKVGDSIRFTRNDREMGRINGARAEVTVIDPQAHTAEIRNERGHIQTLNLDAVRDQHIAHAYVETAFAAQGRTADHVIIHADSNAANLMDQKSFYVALSRGKESATIYTNDRGKLIAAINERAGVAQTALPILTVQTRLASSVSTGIS